MEAYKIVSKAAMPSPAYKGECVSAKQLIVIEEGGERKLIVKFANGRNESVDEITLKVDMFDERGAELGSQTVTCKNVDGAAKRTFTLERKLALPKGTFSCKAKVVSARYSDYIYEPSGKHVKVTYSPKSWETPPDRTDYRKSLGKSGIAVTRRSLKMPALIMAITLIAMVLAVGGFAGYIGIYKSTHDSFLHGSVEYTFVDDSENSDVYITGFTGNRTEITIPKEIEGHAVRGISQRAFSGNSKVKKVTLEGEFTVGENAFYSCTSLREINLENATAIAADAFYGCVSLQSVALDNVAVIGDNAFYGCASLEKVTVGKAIDRDTETAAENDETKEPVRIGAAAFGNCAKLKSVDIQCAASYSYGEKGPFLQSYAVEYLHIPDFDCETVTLSGIAALFGADPKRATTLGKKLGLKELEVDEIDFIPSGFASDTPLESVTVSAMNTPTIGDSAFSGCSSLSAVGLPVNIERVGANAFSGTALMYFNGSALRYVGDRAFSNCASLSTFVPMTDKEFEYLGKESFYGCRALKAFTVPAGVAEIPSGLLGACTSLASVTFADAASVTEISDGAFENCTSLTGLDIPENIVGISDRAFAGCRLLWDFELPDSLETLGARAFDGCVSLSKLTLPDSLEKAGLGALFGCKNLSELSVPFIGETPDITENSFFAYIFGAEKSALSGDVLPVALEKVTVRDSAFIPDRAFENCATVKSVTFGGNVAAVGKFSFTGCSALKELTFGESLSSIGQGAFTGCALENFTVPDGVAEIGNGAFSACESLKTLTVPFVGGSARNNSYLSYIFGSGIDTDAGAVPSSLTKVCVTGQTALAPRAFYGCKSIEEVVLPEELESIGSSAFFGCAALSELVLPENLRYIGQSAFGGCASMTELSLPLGLISVGKGAFEGCTSLARLSTPFVGSDVSGGTLAYMFGDDSADVPRSLEKVSLEGTANLSYGAFENCGYIKEVELGDQLIGIGGNAFKNCRSIRCIVLPETVRRIMTDAFDGCHFLYEVFNYSPLEISPKSADNGKVAYYALIVHTEDGDRLDTFESGGFEFVLDTMDNPYLMGIASDAKQLTMPTSITYKGKTYDSYSVWARFMEGNDRVTGITVSSSVTEIGERAFADCTALQTVSFSANRTIEVFGDEMFTGCTALTSVGLPQKLTRLGMSSFMGCSSLESIVVPETVAYIGAQSFYECKSLKEATLPERLTVLESGLFFGCENLERVSLSSDELTVRDQTFYGCKELRELIAGSRGNKAVIRSVGEHGFGNCRSLPRIALSASLASTDIGLDAFIGCGKLHEIWSLGTLGILPGIGGWGGVALNAYIVHTSLATELPYYKADGFHFIKLDEWYLVDYHNDSETVKLAPFYYGDEIVSSFSVEKGAFLDCTDMVSLTSEDVSIAVRYGAFVGCTGLETIDLSVVGLGVDSGAFKDCEKLKTVRVSAPLEGEDSSYAILSNNAFEGRGEIETLSLSARNVSVATNALSLRGKLKELEIASADAVIDQFAFANSESLESVRISAAESLQLMNGAFTGCAKLKSVKLGKSETCEINAEAFYACKSLESLSLEADTAKIGDLAFYGCALLPELTLYGVESVGNSAFFGCESLTSLTFVGGLKTVGTSAFANCGSLKELDLPLGTERIEYGAFRDCRSLTDLELPEGLTYIGGSSFYGCDALQTLTLPSTLVYLGETAFYGCTSLKELAFPDALETVGSQAFTACRSLVSLSLGEGIKTIGTRAFEGSEALTSLKIPDSLIDIGDYAFTGCRKLGTLELGENLTYIGNYAFASCESLEKLELQSRLSYLGNGAFTGARSLKELDMADAPLTSVMADTFYGAESLASLTLPGTVRTIGNRAFYNCANLTYISLPASLTSIGGGAFGGATKLFAVHNESRLSIKQFSDDNGAVGYYALVISSVKQHTDLKYADSDNFKFVLNPQEGMWYLYGFVAADTKELLSLPEKVTLGGTEVASYNIKSFAFDRSAMFSSVVIPTSVGSIKQNAFARRIKTVYFGGTEYDDFYICTEGSQMEYDMLYLFRPCKKELHPYYWNYDENGFVSTSWVFPSELKSESEATCLKEGLKTYDCEECGFHWEEYVPKLDHEYSKVYHDICINCGTQRVTKENFGSLEWLKDDKVYPFDLSSDGTLKSVNYRVNTSSALTIVVPGDEERKLAFDIGIPGFARTSLHIYVNGMETDVFYDYGDYRYERILSGGDTVMIVCYKDASSTASDPGSISIRNLRLEPLEPEPPIFDVLPEPEEEKTERGESDNLPAIAKENRNA